MNKYKKKIFSCENDESINVDVYNVINAWELTNSGCQHALKKILQAGQRHSKSEIEDLEESIVSIQRDIDEKKKEENKQLNSDVKPPEYEEVTEDNKEKIVRKKKCIVCGREFEISYQDNRKKSKNLYTTCEKCGTVIML